MFRAVLRPNILGGSRSCSATRNYLVFTISRIDEKTLKHSCQCIVALPRGKNCLYPVKRQDRHSCCDRRGLASGREAPQPHLIYTASEYAALSGEVTKF